MQPPAQWMGEVVLLWMRHSLHKTDNACSVILYHHAFVSDRGMLID